MADPSDTIEAGLRRIRARRRREWYFAIAVPFVVAPLILIFAVYKESFFFIARLAIPALVLLIFVHYVQLRWSRCPRCKEYFFGRYTPFDLLDMKQHEDKCQHCGLALYRTDHDSLS